MGIHLPQNRKDTALFTIFWLGGIFTIVYECYFILWSYHDEWNRTTVFLHMLTFYFAVIIYTSMYKIISTDVSYKCKQRGLNPDGENLLKKGWKYCTVCDWVAPPRSHHCKICNECILKRDHHCWYAGYCIGFQNHRYFFCLVLHASLAGLFANYYNWEYVMKVKGGFAWTTIPSLIAPQMGLVLGQYTVLEFIITIITSCGVMFTIFFVTLLAVQCIQLGHGQVQHEKIKGITDYSLGFKNSVAQTFGSAGLWALFFPFVRSTFPGDGTEFATRTDIKVE